MCIKQTRRCPNVIKLRNAGARRNAGSSFFGYGNHRLCRWRLPVKAYVSLRDHGNKQIKTASRIFTSGLVESDTRPPFGDNILFY